MSQADGLTYSSLHRSELFALLAAVVVAESIDHRLEIAR